MNDDLVFVIIVELLVIAGKLGGTYRVPVAAALGEMNSDEFLNFIFSCSLYLFLVMAYVKRKYHNNLSLK